MYEKKVKIFSKILDTTNEMTYIINVNESEDKMTENCNEFVLHPEATYQELVQIRENGHSLCIVCQSFFSCAQQFVNTLQEVLGNVKQESTVVVIRPSHKNSPFPY